MLGIIIYECNDNDYLGVATPSCLGDYCENKKVGDKVEEFINRHLDFDTQLIALSTFAIYDAKELCSYLGANHIDAAVIAYCDYDEKPYEYTDEFIGYDVCAGDYYVSPLGLGYFKMTSDEVEYMVEDEFTNDLPFFENLDNAVRYEYAEKLNEYSLFDSKEIADEIAEYCNWLSLQYEDIFEGIGDFRVVKIYKVS